jgi:hypothetical protein
MNKKDALKKWCPFAMVRNGRDASPYNRTKAGNEFFSNPEKARCIANDCMMWNGAGCGLSTQGSRPSILTGGAELDPNVMITFNKED